MTEELDWPPAPEAADFLRVGHATTEFFGNRDLARQQFRTSHAIHFNNILDHRLLALILKGCASNPFIPDATDPGHPHVESPQIFGRILDVALMRAAMLRWLEDVTDCGPLDTFRGRLTQTSAGTAEHRGWHDDLVESDKRRLALVINLSPEPFTGGAFQMRRKTGERLLQHHYGAVGEAILFRDHPDLEHRSRRVLTGGPRRVYAGWACAC